MNNKGTDWKPTAKQKAFIDVLFNSETATSIVQACKEAKVGRTTVYEFWFKDENFLDYVRDCREKVARFHLPRVDSAMIRKGKGGDVSAGRLLYERFDNLTQKIEANVDGKIELIIGTSLKEI